MLYVVLDELYECSVENACEREFGGKRFWEWSDARGCNGGLKGNWMDIVLQS